MSRWDGTHENLQRAALELFAANGYDRTSTAQIADRAGVSEMTLFRHFASKEALLLDDPFDPLIADAVASRPSDEGPVAAVVAAVRDTWTQFDEATLNGLRDRLRIVAATPVLRGAVERNSARSSEAIVSALGARGISHRRARVTAAAVIAALSAALVHWAEYDDTSIAQAIGDALDVLSGD
ncbi:helix-turn-helix domain-containing protein [Microbacterium sp. ARD32]|uniref:TetR/AcrR family transcriptional regulator n=1 Tax=Microbacterium sp. ARD32 TaxID=2962577 RepID=UPI0028810027|nr:helix-turn-helix domain-containing protein [Microbacterium sp. ARD32]MDT0158334.1 helix-turn-helix domain-containing protein [Microbacterium sp. ARD32]